jgi:hypothetical protein
MVPATPGSATGRLPGAEKLVVGRFCVDERRGYLVVVSLVKSRFVKLCSTYRTSDETTWIPSIHYNNANTLFKTAKSIQHIISLYTSLTILLNVVFCPYCKDIQHR